MENKDFEKDKVLKELQDELAENFDNDYKDSINYYDIVELIAEKESYTQAKVHKGDIGCVIDPYISSDEILVDFSWVEDDGTRIDAIIPVNINDLKKIVD